MELPLKGIIPPVVTPLLNYNKIDEAGLERLIIHLENGGVHGLFLLGTNGEGVSLSYELRKKFIRQVCRLANKRIPVIVCITDASLEGILEMANFCEQAGADMIVFAPPYYYPVSQAEVMLYLDELAPKLNLPFLLYNMPSHTKVHLTIETISHARDLGGSGVKDSSGDMSFFYSLVNAFRDTSGFSVLTGTEMFIPEAVMCGGHGGVAGGANIFPHLFVKLYNAALEKDYEKINNLRQIVLKINENIYNVGNFASRGIAGTKCALSVAGLCSDYMAPPLQRMQGAERAEIERYVNEINLLTEKI